MSDTLINRLRGSYKVGPDNEFGTRDFSDFIPPISLEAADRIEELEAMLADRLDLIKCGIAHNYGGDPYENEKYTSVVELLENT